jgi:uncharacterized small protein (DUF1192 family)
LKTANVLDTYCAVLAQLSARVAGPPGDNAFKGEDMAKALLGHVGSASDRRLLDEVTLLRAKVRNLEVEIARLRAENDRLVAATAEADELFRLPEPALT